MAELRIASARSSSSIPALLLATLVLAVAAAAVFYFNPHRISDFRIIGVETYAPQVTFGALAGSVDAANGTHVLDAPSSSTESDLYLLAKVSLTDKLRLPLFISGAVAHVTLADGTQMESNLLSAADLNRLELIFPELHQRVQNPVTDGQEVSPGQTLTGTVVLPFPGQSARVWHAKQRATLTIELRNQRAQTAVLP